MNGNHALDPFALQARTYPRVLRVARAIADLAAGDQIATEHVAEAIQYRRIALHN